MTLLTPEQIAAANKAQFDTLFGLTNKAFEGLEKLLELNLQVVKSTLAEGQENAQRVLSVKDAQELLALQTSLAQPVAEKALSYGCHLYEIASLMQAEFARVAEEQYEDQNRKVQTLVENVAKNAPAGSETAVAVMKSAITAANTTYETIHKASKLSKSPKATSTQPLRPPRRLHRKLRLKLRAPPRRLSKRIHSHAAAPATPVWPRDGQAV
ncbi:MAG: Granule-associated protein [uncultured Caballeronia sp.]|nr:MAG: Granule-associated protein [uncultured Caballeronia sp.]